MTGSYVPAGEPYARSFVFAMLLDCQGRKEVVTVQRSTGNLPVCESGQEVELTGTPVWNKYLVDGHYEVNDPSGVTCRSVAQAATPRAPATPPPMMSAVVPVVWLGRYQDSRGGGTITFTLVRGTSTVSGTWKLRTGGGGPVTGLIEADGRADPVADGKHRAGVSRDAGRRRRDHGHDADRHLSRE